MTTRDPKTIKAYQNTLDSFESWLNGRKITSENAEDLVQSYVNYFSKNHAPNTVWNYHSRIKKYLRHLKINIDEIELPAKIEKELYALRLDDIHRIFRKLNYQDQFIFGIQACSGLRIGEMVGLRKKDFVWFDSRYIIRIPASIAKFKKARTTVMSKEMSSLVKSRLRKIDDSELVFGTSPSIHKSETNKESTLRRALDATGLDMRYEDTGRYQINTHSFRAFFITHVSRHDPNIAKKMTGEKGYLLQYDRVTDDELIANYEKFEADLTIFDLPKRDELQNKMHIEMEERMKNLEETNLELKSLINKIYNKVLNS